MSVVIIKPYIDKENDSMGLWEEGVNAMPGTKQVYPVPIVAERFLTGFDENAAYISTLSEEDKKKEIKRIKDVCSKYAKEYGHLNICDCSLENKLYDKMSIELDASNTYFDTNNIMDVIKLSIIKTSALYLKDFIIAPTFRDIMETNQEYKYYISDEVKDVEETVKRSREVNKAIRTLDELAEEDKAKFNLVLKFLLRANKNYSKESDTLLYHKMNEFIAGRMDGENVKDGEDNYKKFMKVAKMPLDELITKVVIKYGIHMQIIRQNRDKEYIYITTGQELGKTPEEVYNSLSNPKFKDAFDDIKTDVEKEVKIY